MLMVLRTVCGVGSPVLLPFFSVVISGLDDTAWTLGVKDGLDGVFSLEGACGTGGSAEVGGSAAGRDNTGRDISFLLSSRWPEFPELS